MKKAFIFVMVTLSISTSVHAKKKVQEVNFDGADIDGKANNPDGAYLLQKRGVDFLPLYKIRSNFDENIKESVEYLR